jgi:hypothetical protein
MAIPLLLLTACANADGGGTSTGTNATKALDTITVSGEVGSKPTVKFETKPTTLTSSGSKVVTEGTGETISKGQEVTLDYLLLNGKDGSEADTSFGKTPATFTADPAQLLPGLANGREASALEIQLEYYAKARDFVQRRGTDATAERVLDLWERTIKAVDSGDLGLVEREIDWVTKYQLIERYREKHGLALSSPRVAQIDLAYHDVSRRRGLYYLLERKGAVDRVTTDLRIFEAKSVPPQTTRARLRGDFIKKAQEKRRDFTVDWVHLKLNDQAQRTVLCKDPFRSVDDRVEKLIASM